MAKIESSFFDISTLDNFSFQSSPIHGLDPRSKLLTTLCYIVFVMSFDKYAVSGLLPFISYPVVLMALGNLPPGYLLKKILLAAPFAFFIGIFNPVMDRTILMHLGPVAISGGWISFVSIMLRFVLTVSSALILIGTTGFNEVCMALERLGAPKGFVVQLLFLYRYIFVLADEGSRMVRARSLRAFGGRGMGFRVYVHMIGQLLLRTLDRAQRIHLAMVCRGFDGEIRLVRQIEIRRRDIFFFLGWSAFFVLARFYNTTQLVGDAVTELLK